MRKIILIDGNALIFRAYFATERRMTIANNGIPTNALYLFSSIIMKLIEKKDFDDILVALDSPGKKFRHKEYQDYKANRKEVPIQLKQQFEPIKEFLNICNIKTIEIEGYEADDIIGTLTRHAKAHDAIINVYTGDRDLLQLIDDNTTINMMHKGLSEVEVFDAKHLMETYGILPLQVIDMKALMGDTADNIPGVKGVGEKTASDLVIKYQSLDNIYAHIDEITGKLKEKLENDKEMAYLSYELATIARDIDLDLSLLDDTYKTYDKIKLHEFFTRFQIKSLLKYTKEEEDIKANTNLDIKANIVTKISKDLLTKDAFIFVDNDNENYHYGEIRGLAIATKDKYEYINVDMLTFDFDLIDYLSNKDIPKNVFDGKMALLSLRKVGIFLENIGFDFLLGAYLLHQDFDNISSLFIKYQYVIDKPSRNATIDENAIFALKVATSCANLKDKILEEIDKIDNRYLLFEIEQPLSIILAKMERNGVLIDSNLLAMLNKEYSEKIDNIQEKINEMVGYDFNINSPTQLATLLYDRLGLKANKKRSTSADYLNEIKDSHPIVPLILEYRKYTKLLSTYIDSFESFKFPDNRIHAIFSQSSTMTGRLSSSQPNLQNLSVRDDERSIIRKLVIAPQGYKILSLDYSQIELRILALLSQDENLLAAFKNGYDIHKATAAKIFNVPLDEVTTKQRRIAKATNFGIVYGISTWGLAEQIDSSLQEAKDIIEKFFQTYPHIKEFLDNNVKYLEDHGYVTTMMKRRRNVPEINSSNYNIKEFAKRVAMNTPIQGSAADLIKVAMIRVDKALKPYENDCKLICQIHDELLFEVKEEKAEMLKDIIKDIMENVLDDKTISLKVSYAIGNNWLEAK